MMANRMNNRGFTLLELLLVVLVVGILATLAMPQYTNITEKARASEAIAMIGAVKTAQDIYKLETGSYTATLTNLTVLPPTGGAATYWTYALGTASATTWSITATRTSKKAPTSPPATQTIILSWNDAGTPPEKWSGTHTGKPQ